MSKTRLTAGMLLVLVAVAIAAVASVSATAKPAMTQAANIKVGFITKFPVGFYFTLVDGAKSWQKTHKNVSVTYVQGKSATDDAGEIAAIQDMVASGVKGIAPRTAGVERQDPASGYFAGSLWQSRGVDVLAWVAASSRASVLSGYVQAAVDRGHDAGDAESVAARFMAWLRGPPAMARGAR